MSIVTNWPVGVQAIFFHSLEIQPGLPAWRFGPIVPYLQFICFVTNWPVGFRAILPFMGDSARITTLVLRSNNSYF